MQLTKKLATRGALAGAVCVAIALPAVAIAATPVKGATYSDQKTSSFAEVSKKGHSAKLTVFPGKCNHGIPLQAKGAISKDGDLTFDGSAVELGTQNGTAHLKLEGTFTNSKTLKWTAHVHAGSCTSTVKDTLTLMKSQG